METGIVISPETAAFLSQILNRVMLDVSAHDFEQAALAIVKAKSELAPPAPDPEAVSLAEAVARIDAAFPEGAAR